MPTFVVMRWLMIGLLISLAGLLFAAAGVARHIWIRRAKLRRKTAAGKVSKAAPGQALDPAEETELEP
jgi:HAMP domain-containing protein